MAGSESEPTDVRGWTEKSNAPDEPMSKDEIMDVARERFDAWVQSRGGDKLHLPHPYDKTRPWCGWKGEYRPKAVETRIDMFHELCGFCQDEWNEKGYPFTVDPVIAADILTGGDTDGTQAD